MRKAPEAMTAPRSRPMRKKQILSLVKNLSSRLAVRLWSQLCSSFIFEISNLSLL